MHQPSDDARGPARTLALTRIVAGAVIVFGADVHGAARFAALAPQLVTTPPGLDWLRVIELTTAQARALTWAVVVVALLGSLGAYARFCFALTSVGLSLLLALPQRLGAVSHAHHLLWVSLLLAASPCADVWSVDAYFAPRALGPRAQYSAPLVVLRSLTACVYFFPGVHKLISFLAGTDPAGWMRSHAAWKWMQRGAAPALGQQLASLSPGMLALGALGFELSMPLLVAFRRTRPLALAGILSFHLGTAFLLFIRFESLVVLWVSLLDLGRGRAPRAALAAKLAAAQRSTLAVGGSLVTGALITGVMGNTQLYPFACYPTFAESAPPTMPSARVVLVRGDMRCALPRPLGNAEWVAAFRIAGAYGDALDAARARAYLRRAVTTQGSRSTCGMAPDSELWLVLETLRWDFARQRVQVVSERVVYSAHASELGIAPAGTNAASSSPVR